MAYSPQQLETALRAAHAAGDEIAARKLAVRLKASRPPKKHISEGSKANIAADEAAYRQSAPEGTLEKLAIGNTAGWANIGRHALNTVGLMSDEKLADAKALDKPLTDTKAGAAGKFVGEVAALAPLGGVGNAGRAALAGKSVLARAAVPLAEGAVAGQLTEGNAAGGAVAGGVLGLGGTVLGKAIRGMRKTPQAQKLLDEGADLTPGQLDPDSWWARREGAARSAPFGMGAGIDKARSEGLKAAEPSLFKNILGRRASGKNPQEWMEDAYKHTNALYDSGKGFKIRPQQLAQLDRDVAAAVQAAIQKSPLSDDQKLKLARELFRHRQKLGAKPDSGEIKEVLSQLRTDARKGRIGSAADSDSRAFSDALDAAEGAYASLRTRIVPPGVAQNLKEADRVYGDVKVLESAVEASGPDRIKQNALNKALRRSQSKRQYVRGGGGQIREMSDAMAHVENLPGGMLQRPPFVSAPIGGAIHGLTAAVPAAAATIGPLRRAARGGTGAQRAAQAVNRRIPRRLKKALAGLRPALVGEMTPETEQ